VSKAAADFWLTAQGRAVSAHDDREPRDERFARRGSLEVGRRVGSDVCMLPSLADPTASVTRFRAVFRLVFHCRALVVQVAVCRSLQDVSSHAPREAAGS
jgi:hypothetical protein